MQQFKLAEGNSNRDTVEAIARDYSGLDLGSGAAAAATNAAQTLGRRALEERQFAKTLQNELLKEEMGNRAEMQKALMTGSMERDKMREKAELDYRDTLARNMGIDAKAKSDLEIEEMRTKSAERIKTMDYERQDAEARGKKEEADMAAEAEFTAAMAEAERLRSVYPEGTPQYNEITRTIQEMSQMYKIYGPAGVAGILKRYNPEVDAKRGAAMGVAVPAPKAFKEDVDD